jgi:hypothetical protein
MIGAIALSIFMFLVGKWTDPVFQVKQKRNLTKKEWMLVIIRDRDGKTLSMRPVLPECGTIKFKGSDEIWIVKKDRIYRADKEEKGFKIGKDDLKFFEGVPCLIITHDSVKPSRFADEAEESDGIDTRKEKTGVIPLELGIWAQNYIDNEIAKDRETMKKLFGIIMLILILALVDVVVSGAGTAKTFDMGTALSQCINTTINNTMCTAQHAGGFVPVGGGGNAT